MQDQWFDIFLKERRAGDLSEEMYNFLMGLPTEHAGSWLPRKDGTGIVECGLSECSNLPARWRHMALKGSSWMEMEELECTTCRSERARRNRLIAPNDPRILKEPFLSAPYVHRNNEPKYHAMLLRAVEQAKRGEGGPKCILWVRAQDMPHNPKEIASTADKVDKKRERVLQFLDQKTLGFLGLLPYIQV